MTIFLSMPFDLLPYFFSGLFIFKIFSGIFFSQQKKQILTHYKHSDSKEINNIFGKIIIENGFLRKNIQWCSFTLLINRNSLFIFPKDFYFIPSRSINIIFSNSDRKFTRHPIMLRKITVSKNSVELICYPDAISGSRRIQIQNLNKEQVSVFNKIINNNNYH